MQFCAVIVVVVVVVVTVDGCSQTIVTQQVQEFPGQPSFGFIALITFCEKKKSALNFPQNENHRLSASRRYLFLPGGVGNDRFNC